MAVQRLSNSGQSGYGYKSLIAGITPLPSVPTIGTATALTYSTATVEFTAPGDYSGSTYTATSSPDGLTGTSATSPITVTGLSGETTYTFTVTATNATGTSGASAASNSVTTPAAFSPTGYMDALAAVTVPSGGVSTVTFSAIPSTYTHLQVRLINDVTANDDSIRAQFNSDTGANYSWHTMYADGNNVYSDFNGVSSTFYGTFSRGGNANGAFTASVVDILDYQNTNKYKTIISLTGKTNNTDGLLWLSSGLWRSTNAINSIKLYPISGSFKEFSSFALYGIRG